MRCLLLCRVKKHWGLGLTAEDMLQGPRRQEMLLRRQALKLEARRLIRRPLAAAQMPCSNCLIGSLQPGRREPPRPADVQQWQPHYPDSGDLGRVQA